MSDQQELVLREDAPVTAPVAITTAGTLLEVIARAARDPLVDVGKLERLLAIQQTVIADDRRTAFMAAMTRLAPKLPRLAKTGRIQFKSEVHGRYAKLEDIDAAIRPLLSEEGFSLSFDVKPADSGKLRVSCRLSHVEGHSETNQIDLPVDKTGSKNDVQAVGSTVSYARRMLTKMHFNLIEVGEDDDGAGGGGTITVDQARDIEALLVEVKGDKVRFLRFMEAETFEGILAKHHKKAITFLEEKRRRMGEQAR